MLKIWILSWRKTNAPKDYYAMAGYFFLAGTILLVIGHSNHAMQLKARSIQDDKSSNDPEAD